MSALKRLNAIILNLSSQNKSAYLHLTSHYQLIVLLYKCISFEGEGVFALQRTVCSLNVLYGKSMYGT